MATPILATKLYLPPPRPGLVPRPRLIEQLAEGLRAGRKLTLVAAPAGFGKTTLLSEWLSGNQQPAAWLALDENDNDPARFLAYFIAALQTIDAGLGAEALSLLQAHQPPPTDVTLATLINEIAGTARDFALVLDDYHLIEHPSIHEALTFLLGHLPRQMHLVMASRADPPLPLARQRARGELTELRAADLRFTPNEAAAFLNQVMGLRLAPEDIAALENRTEGWIAGLQMAALSMQGRADLAGFIQAFTGSHRYIIDYLAEEVLQRQTADVSRFLLQTSILDRLSGPLCDAVTGQANGSATLQALERRNLFVVPLDDQRQWYRYHHLFADVLQARLREAQPDQVPALHQRASEWCALHELPVEAVRHALAARDFERAVNLVEAAWPAIARSRQEAVLRGWLRALPDELVRRRPVLSAYAATVLLLSGELEGAEQRLQDAERWLEDPAQPPVVANEDELRRLPVAIAIGRAGLAQARGDIASTLHYAQQARESVQPGDHLGRAGAAGFLGLALWARGDLAAAQQTFAEAVTSMHLSGNHADALSGTMALAEMQIGRGGLREARRILQEAGQLAATPDAPVPNAAADLLVALSEVDREQNDLAAAEAHLLNSKALGEHASLPENRYRWPVAMARLRAAHGDLDTALSWLGEAERLYMRGFFPETRPIGALRARVWIAHGRLAEAAAWAQAQGLTAHDEPSYRREFEHLTLARLLMAQYRDDPNETTLQKALDLLERLLAAAEAGSRTGSVIEVLMLQALAHALQRVSPTALAPLERALSLAEPEGYVRLFVDEGPPMAALLERLTPVGGRGQPADGGRMKHYVNRLLDAFGKPENLQPPAPGSPRGSSSGGLSQASHGGQPLLEPLSERELEVLRLLLTELSGPEIARQLSISLNTFNTHTRNIYGKLGVKSRLAAVRRAEELNLA